VGTDGKGWITTAYVQATGLTNLPVVSQSGEVIGTATAESNSPTATPLPVAAAVQDNDSATAPAARVSFSPSGTRSLIYSSDVSFPDGDIEDWIEFTPYGTNVTTSLVCSGNGALKVELLSNGISYQNWSGLACGEKKQQKLLSGDPYILHISVVPGNSSLEYVHYTLSVENLP
jgi:hypothetical protein